MNISRRTSSRLGIGPALLEPRAICPCLRSSRSDPPDVVDGPALGDRHQPAAGIVRHALGRATARSAATSASWASSSASPTSRTIRVSPPMIRADSSFQTASTVRPTSRRRAHGPKTCWITLSPSPTIPRKRRASSIASSLDRDLDQREPGDGLLGLGERAVGHRDLLAAGTRPRADARARGRRWPAATPAAVISSMNRPISAYSFSSGVGVGRLGHHQVAHGSSFFRGSDAPTSIRRCDREYTYSLSHRAINRYSSSRSPPPSIAPPGAIPRVAPVEHGDG